MGMSKLPIEDFQETWGWVYDAISNTDYSTGTNVLLSVLCEMIDNNYSGVDEKEAELREFVEKGQALLEKMAKDETYLDEFKAKAGL
jgi:hypothetical protein